MSKQKPNYDRLEYHLRTCGKDRVMLTHAQIGEIIGGQLPESARTHPRYWGNEGADTRHAIAIRLGCIGWQWRMPRTQ